MQCLQHPLPFAISCPAQVEACSTDLAGAQLGSHLLWGQICACCSSASHKMPSHDGVMPHRKTTYVTVMARKENLQREAKQRGQNLSPQVLQ